MNDCKELCTCKRAQGTKKVIFGSTPNTKKTSLHSSVARWPKRPEFVVPGRPPLATAVVFNTHRRQQSRTIFCQEKTQFGRKFNPLWNIGAYVVCCRTLSLIPVSKNHCRCHTPNQHWNFICIRRAKRIPTRFQFVENTTNWTSHWVRRDAWPIWNYKNQCKFFY